MIIYDHKSKSEIEIEWAGDVVAIRLTICDERVIDYLMASNDFVEKLIGEPKANIRAAGH